MFFFTYTAAILTVLCIGFAAFLLTKKREEMLARFLATHFLTVGLWVGANAAADISSTPRALIFWSGIALISSTLLVSHFLCFAHVFIRRSRPATWRLTAYFLPPVLFALGAFSRYSVVDTIFPANQPTQIVPGILYSYGIGFFWIGFIIAAAELAVFYRKKASPVERLQVLYLEAGFLFLFLGLIIFDYVLPLLGELRFFNVGPQFAVVMLGFTSYAILKHRLLDIKVVIQKSVIYLMLLGMIVLIYLNVISLTFLFTEDLTDQYLLASILTTVIGIFAAPPLKRYFEKLTDHLFFKHRYVFSEAVHELSQVLNRHLSLNSLTDGVAVALRKILKVRDARLIVLEQPVPYDGRRKLETRDDFRQLLGDALLDGLVPLSAALIVPVILKYELIALICLEGKSSVEPFYADDIKLLRSFSYQAAVAVEKARLYRRVQDYSGRLEDKVQKRTAEVKSLHELQAGMIIDIAHGLQTPLTVMRGQIDAAKNAEVDWTGLSALEKSIEKISGFIQRLLRLAALDAPENPKKERVDLSALAEEIITYFSILAKQQKITIETSVTRELSVCGSRGQLEEMILNILSNAAKFIANDRRIIIDLNRDDGYAVLTVRDTGIGIAPDDLDKVFHRFHRSAESRETPGYGLGLAICKKIADLHGGTITLTSAKGRGTTVTVALPLVPALPKGGPCSIITDETDPAPRTETQ